MEGRTDESQERRPASCGGLPPWGIGQGRDGGFEEEAKATEDAHDRVTDRRGRRGRVLEGPSDGPEASGASREPKEARRTAREDVRGRPNDPQSWLRREHDDRFSNRLVGLPVLAPGVSHGPRRPANLMEAARSGAHRASEPTGNPLCNWNLCRDVHRDFVTAAGVTCDRYR
jgi:hypothetical protein